MKIDSIYPYYINDTQSVQRTNVRFVPFRGELQADKAEFGSSSNVLTNMKLAAFSFCINVIGIFQPEAAALWNLALSRVPRDSKYIAKNGTYYDSIYDLGDEDLRQYVYRHINAQVKKEDSKGVIFNDNSSLAKAIKNSNELRTEIKNNKENLLENRYAEDMRLKFSNGNLKNAFHFAKVTNVHLDDSDNLCLTVFDTYDFNPNQTNFLVKTAREFQEKDKIETYYLMVEMKIPKEEWINY